MYICMYVPVMQLQVSVANGSHSLIPAHNEYSACIGVINKQTVAYISADIKLNLTFIIHT